MHLKNCFQKSGLRNRLLLLTVGILLVYFILTLACNLLLMERFYRYHVKNKLLNAKDILSEMDEPDMETIIQLEEQNISVVIADIDTDEIIYNSRYVDHFMPDFIARIIPDIHWWAENSPDGYYIDINDMKRHTASGVEIESEKRIMLGAVTERYLFELSTSYTSVREAASISLEFTFLIGIVVLIIALFACYRQSSGLTQPLVQITNVADQIAHLDFSQKCPTNTVGEIKNLAESINTMSDFMQTHINELQAANAQLKEDIKIQQAQEAARKDLLANLSHDLKTPIGLISGYADGLRNGMAKTDQEVTEYCDIIVDESDRMMTMIQRLMELFRLESGTVQPELEDFNLSDLLDYILDIFSIEIVRQNIQLSSSYPNEMYIHADYSSVEQVVTNYMQNAVNHISNGHDIRLTVTDTGSHYRLSIYNSSAPISEEECSKIWDSFYRLDKSRARENRHSGLGLSIVRENMDLLNSPYGVSNVEGGVSFWAEFKKSEDVTTHASNKSGT